MPMKNKSTVMAFCGLQILVFHLWITVANGNIIEAFLKNTAYIGVDIFFFMSAYSFANREISSYGAFVKNRFFSVYLKFLIFCVVAFFYSGWPIMRLGTTMIGWQFLTRGGGAFLWFLPAIMLLYLIFPLYKKFDEKKRELAIGTLCIVWLLGAFFITKITGLSHLAIMWNRLPMYFLGYYWGRVLSEKNLKISAVQQLVAGVVLTVVGVVITYNYGFMVRLQNPFIDMFYIASIPFALGVMLLVDLIPSVKIIKMVGASTLEMYALQMIFGYRLANVILAKTNNALLTNLIIIISIIVVSVLLSLIYNKIKAVITKNK